MHDFERERIAARNPVRQARRRGVALAAAGLTFLEQPDEWGLVPRPSLWRYWPPILTGPTSLEIGLAAFSSRCWLSRKREQRHERQRRADPQPYATSCRNPEP